MRLPFKPSMMKIRRTKVKFLVLHHTVELYENPNTYIDNQKYQFPSIINGVLELKQADVNYNFLLEKIKDDFQVFVARPFPYLCDWDDIDTSINNACIHIGVMGNFDLVNPTPRLYDVLSYRLLNPLLNLFHLSANQIMFHSQLSKNKKCTCPGVFFDKEKLITMVRKFVIK